MAHTLAKWGPYGLAALRIITALLFVQHGLMKLVSFPGPQAGVPDPMPVIVVVAAWIEIVGGSLIAVGLLTRSTAFLCSGTMAVAYFVVHAPQSVWPGLNGGEGAIFFCLIFFHLVFAGPGAVSLDGVLRERKGLQASDAASR